MSDTETTIVVGVDGSDRAVRAARWAGAMAARIGGSLRLVHALPSVDEALLALIAPTQVDAGAHPRKLGFAVLDRAADAVRVDHPKLRLSRKLSHLAPEAALTESSRGARLLVVACADVSPRGALLVGSMTLSIARRSVCPVVAWRGQSVAPTMEPIVVGVDDADHDDSRAALATAFGLANLLAVPLRIVHAMSTRRTASEVDVAVLVDREDLEDGARQRLSDRIAPLARGWPEVHVTHLVGVGRASRVILDHTAGTQMVVIGSRHHGSVRSALTASTGLGLLHHSPVPVVSCPATFVWPFPAPDGRRPVDVATPR